ncbi:hypothetical protein FGLOB1_11189 [Fusarium globosum]|uniref:Uncharacterized protein n=1 Tax=Fusarium globosum TaxID=78864 RepID=A0A8H6D171_9HYPO|nr:hypothetical protein FGLOB1_11189 [Fusarium globosum]
MKVFKLLWGSLHCAVFATVSLITIVLLADSTNEKQGIFKLSFKATPSIRGLPGPMQDIPAQATKALKDTGDIASHATVVVSKATKVAGDVKSKASSVVAAAETLVAEFTPKGCEFGTKYGCIDFGDGSKCTRFSITGDNPWDEFSHLPKKQEGAAEIPQKLPPLEILFILGSVFTVSTSLLSKVNPLWQPCCLPCLPSWLSPRAVCATISSLVAVSMFASLLGIARAILAVGTGLESVIPGGELKRGFAIAASAANLALSCLQFIMIIVECLPFW